MSSHPIVHVDLPVQNTAEDAKFYEAALGWQLNHDPNFDYWMFGTGAEPGGGFTNIGGPYMPGMPEQYQAGKPMVYLGSQDIEADLAKVEANGGRTILPRQSLGEMGAFAIFADPAAITSASSRMQPLPPNTHTPDV